MSRRNLVLGALVVAAFGAFAYSSPSNAAVDPFELLGKSLGMTKDQMAGGLGSMLTLAQEKLEKGDFDKVAAVIPGSGKYIEEAKKLGAVTGPLKNLTGLKSSLGKLGINEKTASSFLSSVPEVVSKVGGEDVGKLLSSVLK